MAQPRVAIAGNTYAVKAEIKALGGRWDAEKRAWMVPAERADEARKLVSSAPTKSTSETKYWQPRKCRVCGHTEARNARGYPVGDRILRSGECQSCYEERRMGY